MVLVHSSSNHPSSTRSRISSLYFSSFLGRVGGRDVITSYHHCRVRGLLPAILIFLINNFSMEGNSVAASSSSFRIAWFISLISSRNVSIEVREETVSSVLEFSLHCSISSSILLAVLYMVSYTFRSPKGVPCVLQVNSRLSHAFMVSSILSRKKTTPTSTWPRRRVIWFRILFRFMVYLSASWTSSFQPAVLSPGPSVVGHLLCLMHGGGLGVCEAAESTLILFLGFYCPPLLERGNRILFRSLFWYGGLNLAWYSPLGSILAE